jgi:cyanophycinase
MSEKPFPPGRKPSGGRWRKLAALFAGFLLAAVLLPHLAGLPQIRSGEAKKPAPERLRPSGIDGALVIGGGGELPEAARGRFVELAGGSKAHLVILSAAGDRPDPEAQEQRLKPWKDRKPASVVLLPARPPKDGGGKSSLEPLRKATGVWLDGGGPARLARELADVLKRGGVVGVNGTGAAALARRTIAPDEGARTVRGLDLLPGTVLVPHFLPEKEQPRLFEVLRKNPGLVGLGIPEGTALVVHGRQLQVLGKAPVVVCLAASSTKPQRVIELKPGAHADLTALCRAAIARAGAPFPPAKAAVPEVPHGTLIIHGGGGMSADLTRKFIELAGGPDALIVILPTANPDPIRPESGAAMFRRAGARNVRVLPARELKDVQDPKNLDVLRKAGGVWFGGGRQWRFVDAYENTRAHTLFRDVLRRGGVIGGSSAGATIQGDYLCRGSPLGNLEMMCEGYERGLGFLPGVAIDQHFSQRNRFADMTALMKAYPQLLGIGIDEATALVVKGHVAEVVGKNKVQFYDRNKPVKEGGPDYEVVGPGGRYDLKARKVLPPEERR